jgi:hypothetical protein
MCNLQYCNKTSFESVFLLFFVKAPEIARGLKSFQGSKQRISTRSLEISTGEQPWSISADTGVGAQVAGAFTAHVHLRCAGKDRPGCTYSFTSSACALSKESLLTLSSSNTAAMTVAGLLFFFSCIAFALAAYAGVIQLQISSVGRGPVHEREKWPA